MTQDVGRLSEAFSALVVSACEESSFRRDGLWASFEYRDLGAAEATDGQVGASHMRALGPCEGPMGWHWHDLTFHLVYILKGRVSYRWEGSDEVVVAKAGDSMIQPPGGAHNVLDYSEDVEVLEITMPAKYPTIDVGDLD